ncbi:MAG TPA: O-antigen ligase family protein [Symbiobacteriaceae bacterium]|nr:O-antigen ligase family protein [Symbiobacteriaceae bacterium]
MTAAERAPVQIPVLSLDAKGLLFAAFLSAGQFKGDPRLSWMPVDLTMLLALAVAAVTGYTLVRDRFTFPAPIGWIGLLFSLFAIPLLWTDMHPYAAEKVTYLYTLTLFAAVASLVLFKTTDDLHRLFNALTLIGLVAAFDAARLLLQGASGDRLSAFGANPIAFGRSIGLIFVWAAILGMEGRLPALPAMGLVGLSGVLLIASGSRGPLLASAGGLAVAGFAFYRRRLKLMLRFAAAALVLMLAVQFGLSQAPGESANRIARLAGGELGSSELTRLDAYNQTLTFIATHPGGIGWGGFASRINQSGSGGDDRQYPHNLFLEVLLEGGWVGGFALLLLLALAFARLVRQPPSPPLRALLLLFCFCVVNAQVSGDLNDNRLLFALTALGLRMGWDDPLGDRQGGSTDVGARVPGHAHLP